MPAPGLMNLPKLQYAKAPEQNQTAQAMQGLGKSLDAFNAARNPPQDPAAPLAPGATVPGSTIAAGGPQGPAPLPGQQGLPGSPYSPAAGPPAPGAGAAAAATPGATPFTNTLPTPAVPYPPIPYPMAGQPNSPIGTWAQNNPLNVMQLLKNSLGGGPLAPPGQPGSALMGAPGAGMLTPGNTLMQQYPGAGG